MSLLVGIFVGGRGSRMGGVAKGLLKAPGSDRTLVDRLREEVRAALGDVPIVLVGQAPAYSFSALPAVPDDPPGIGPIGGLGGLLRSAHAARVRHAIALACDLPYVQTALIARLAAEAPGAAALVAHDGGRRNPLFARYEVARALPAVASAIAAGERALQAVLDSLEVSLLALTPSETRSLRDWDTPEDMRD